MKKLALAVTATLAVASAATAAAAVSLTPLGSVKTGAYRSADPRVAEINAFDAAGQRIYVVNPLNSRLDVIDASTPTALVQAAGASIDIVAACVAAIGAACPLEPGAEPNSVAISGGRMGVAVGSAVRTDNGHAVFFELDGAQAPKFLAAVEVGALPDMITFTPDGRYALTANEGEPNDAYTIDPKGSVSIIELARLGTPRAVRTAGFERFDNPGQRAKLEADGVRIFGPGASVAQDLEPEYLAVSGNKAAVTLQENNAIAIVNVESATVETITGLGLKDYSADGNALDPGDRDGGIRIASWPVHGMYQPDGIYPVTLQGRRYFITANEGDARAYGGYSEERRVGSAAYTLDPVAFPDAAALKADAALGRLTVTTASGDLDGDGDFDRIDTFGGRSVSILDQQGRLVWDSGELLERLAATLDASGTTLFNATNTTNVNSRDTRSDDKAVEPESVVIGEVNGVPYAFVGLERDGGIVVLDLSEPTAPAYVTYANRRTLRDPVTGALLACSNTVDCGDLGPEGLTFVPAAQSPGGKALLIVTNEVSSTTTIWQVE
jgi:DNA-binding beta-propeller fold protein YncE